MQIEEVTLHFLEGENEGVEIKLTPTRELNIGRSEESDVFLGEKKISRKHCQINVTEDEVRIVDFESTNGTLLNGKKISDAKLKSGDHLKIGSSLVEVKIQLATGDDVDSEAGTKPREKSNPKISPKKAPPKKEKKPEPKEEPEELNLEPSASTVHVDDLDNLSGSPKSSKKKKSLEDEDSDLVVEYQSPNKEEEKKKTKEHETSEKIEHMQFDDEGKEESQLSLDPEEEEVDFESEPESESESMAESDSDVSLSEPSLELSNDEPSFDKIMDLDELKENSAAEISLNEKEPPQSSKPLVGDLSSMGLSDLLQNLYQNKKSGILSLSTGSLDGKIFMREGKLLGSESGQATGIKAMYRMLTWKSGDFEFQPMLADSKQLVIDQEPIQDNIETILMEGFRHYDELRKIQKVLPQMEDDLGLEDKLETPISKLHPKVLDVVQLIINHKKMKTVLDLSPFSDLETSKIVIYLIKKKVIRIKK